MNILEKNFINLSSVDKISLLIDNDWTGKAFPEGKDINIQLKCRFELDLNRIIGYMDVDDEGDILSIKLEGGIIKLPFLIFDYFSTNPNIINYGRIMYEINNDWNQLIGRVVGYSGERDFFVIAKHELNHCK
jgi:hypothetical protein